ncbi:MAG: hypothetical protein AB7U75_01140 [Hyphomicrobiaceae bacterium]
MTSDSHAPSGGDNRRRSGNCTRVSLLAALAWAVVTALHGYATWPHIPMDISANDPATRAAFDAVVQRHIAGHAAVGLVPLLAAVAFVYFVCRKRG